MFKRPSNKIVIDPFEAFENRMLKVIHKLSKQDIVLHFNQKQIESLYDKVLSVVETSIFAEMEQIINAIQGSLQVVISMEGERESLNHFMSNEYNFKKFITHVVTNYQSLGEQRIDILMTHNPKYQIMEDKLFGEVFITEEGFEKAFDIHLEIIQAFHNRYHELLFEGVVLDKDSEIETSVIERVIHQYEQEIQVGGAVE